MQSFTLNVVNFEQILRAPYQKILGSSGRPRSVPHRPYLYRMTWATFGGTRVKKLLLTAATLIALSVSAMGQDTSTRLTPEALTWKDNSAFPKGVQIATVVGDPTKAGDVVVLRIKFPPNFQMPPHTHPYSEVVTVISGAIGSSHGEKFEKNGELLKPGSLWVYPAKHAHYAWTGGEESVLQVQFTGPGGIDYINPADDPRKNN